jgi:hypothetical protein
MNMDSRTEMELVWEVSEIAKLIGRTKRQTFHMLNAAQLPAKKGLSNLLSGNSRMG